MNRNRAYAGFVIITVAATVVLVLARLGDVFWLTAAAKLTASTGFIATAMAVGAARWTYGRILLIGLALSWLGDAALLGSGEGAFLAGLVAFLLAHVMYCVAFLWRGVKWSWVAVGAVLVGIVAALVLRWLIPYVPDDMRLPVFIYTGVISLMVALAAGARGAGGPMSIEIGAVLFYLSDLSVASGQFVQPDFPNYVWGLPFYFVGQLFLATSARHLRTAARGVYDAKVEQALS